MRGSTPTQGIIGVVIRDIHTMRGDVRCDISMYLYTCNLLIRLERWHTFILTYHILRRAFAAYLVRKFRLTIIKYKYNQSMAASAQISLNAESMAIEQFGLPKVL